MKTSSELQAKLAGVWVLLDERTRRLMAAEEVYRKQGEIKRSAEMLAQVEPRLRKALPEVHYAFASLESRHSLHAQARGDLAEARVLADKAIAMMEQALKASDAGRNLLPTFRLRRADIEIELRLPDAVVADAAAAVATLTQSAAPGTLSETLGQAYLTLGRAYQARGSSPRSS